MMDTAEFETFKNVTILTKAFLFLIKLDKIAVQSVPKILCFVRPKNKIIDRIFLATQSGLYVKFLLDSHKRGDDSPRWASKLL